MIGVVAGVGLGVGGVEVVFGVVAVVGFGVGGAEVKSDTATCCTTGPGGGEGGEAVTSIFIPKLAFTSQPPLVRTCP